MVARRSKKKRKRWSPSDWLNKAPERVARQRTPEEKAEEARFKQGHHRVRALTGREAGELSMIGLARQRLPKKSVRENLRELIRLLEAIAANTTEVALKVEKLAKGNIDLEKVKSDRNTLVSYIEVVESKLKYEKFPKSATKILYLLEKKFLYKLKDKNLLGRRELSSAAPFNNVNDGIIYWADQKKDLEHYPNWLRGWAQGLIQEVVVPLKSCLEYNVPLGGLSQEADDAISWMAAEFKHIKALRDDIKQIEGASDLHDEVKPARKAKRALRYISSCERRAERALHVLLDGLSDAIVEHPGLLRLDKEIQISSKKLAKAFSLYVGELREELNRLEKDIAARQTKPSKERDQVIESDIKKIAKDVEAHLDELIRWLQGLDASLHGVKDFRELRM